MLKTRWKSILLLLILAILGSGCVQRSLTVRSNPSGAMVSLNDVEVGRTPVTHSFQWYGYYDVEVRLSGYSSVKTVSPVIRRRGGSGCRLIFWPRHCRCTTITT